MSGRHDSGGPFPSLYFDILFFIASCLDFTNHFDLDLMLCLQAVDLAACEIEPGSASRVVLGREQEGLMVYDLDAQRLATTVCCTLLSLLHHLSALLSA